MTTKDGDRNVENKTIREFMKSRHKTEGLGQNGKTILKKQILFRRVRVSLEYEEALKHLNIHLRRI